MIILRTRNIIITRYHNVEIVFEQVFLSLMKVYSFMNQALNFVIVNKITKLKSNNKHLYFDKLIKSHNFVKRTY